MADADFDDFDAYDSYGGDRAETVPAGVRFRKLTNGAGALTSVALVAGLVYWGYALAMRDVNGIPVIRALEGPARIAPNDPGGELALHQGLAVNRIAADGTAAEAANSVTLAPGASGLAEEDQPMGEAVAAAVAPAPAMPLAPPPKAQQASVDAASPLVQTAPPVARPAEPLPDGPADTAGSEIAPPPALDIAPEALAAGTRLVQIGAYSSPDEAKQHWEQTAERYGSLLDGKRRVIEAASSAGQVFYRLRVEGFADVDDARRFCAALEADNAECVPAVVQ